MPGGISVKLPLVVSTVFGPYDLNTTYDELAKQNLKMLVLTSPGERVMDPNFGVGLKGFLFEPNSPTTYDTIAGRIQDQVSVYLPYLTIDGIDFSVPENNPDLFPLSLTLRLSFTIVPLQQSDVLEITVAH